MKKLLVLMTCVFSGCFSHAYEVTYEPVSKIGMVEAQGFMVADIDYETHNEMKLLINNRCENSFRINRAGKGFDKLGSDSPYASFLYSRRFLVYTCLEQTK